jgi:flagellar motor switch protein FliG
VGAAEIRKAAIFLTALDPGTAAELLKAAKPEMITRIATEMQLLQESGEVRQVNPAEPVKDFFGFLRRSRSGEGQGNFVQQMLSGALGPQRSAEVLKQVGNIMQLRDPFMTIRSTPTAEIAQAIASESAQVLALVLSELPSKMSSELLMMLPEAARAEAVRGMTGGMEISSEAKVKVANVITARIEAARKKAEASGAAPVASAAPGQQVDRRALQLRKVAVLLRGLESNFRGALLKAMTEKDADSAAAVQKLMIIWEDMPIMPDRPLQEVLRTVDSRKLALALVKTEDKIVRKIRANISERAGMMLDEESSLLTSPKTEDITASRESILDSLREINNKGELTFQEASE